MKLEKKCRLLQRLQIEVGKFLTQRSNRTVQVGKHFKHSFAARQFDILHFTSAHTRYKTHTHTPTTQLTQRHTHSTVRDCIQTSTGKHHTDTHSRHIETAKIFGYIAPGSTKSFADLDEACEYSVTKALTLANRPESKPTFSQGMVFASVCVTRCFSVCRGGG